MARRRYVSTAISVDPRVNQLAEKWGDFSALLYTWMIPHADDAGELSDDLEQILFTVVPGRRSRGIEDIQHAVDGMLALRLIEHDEQSHVLKFPSAAFLRHQSYINKARRESAQNAAEHRTAPQNAASSSFPVEVSSSATPPASPPAHTRETRRGETDTTICEFSDDERARIATLEARLAQLRGFTPTSEFWRTVFDKYAALDLGEETIKLAAWADAQPPARKVTLATVLNWFKRESEGNKQHGRNGTTRGVPAHGAKPAAERYPELAQFN